MDRQVAASAWRFFEFNWMAIGTMAIALALGVALTDFTLRPAGFFIVFGIAALYTSVAYYNVKAPHRRNPTIVFALGPPAQLAIITVLMTPLTYVAMASNLPMQDATLLAIDRALGFDFRVYLTFVNDRPVLIQFLKFGYAAISWPVFLIPVVLAVAQLYRRIPEFTFAFAFALIVTMIVSALVPALGVYQQIGLTAADYSNLTPKSYLDSLTEIPAVRDGTFRELDLFKLIGILTFPSFHTASAVLYLWAFWPIRWVRPLNVTVNGLLIASTPIGGGHYFIDLIAGAAVAALAIGVARRVGNRLAVGDSLPTKCREISYAPGFETSAPARAEADLRISRPRDAGGAPRQAE